MTLSLRQNPHEAKHCSNRSNNTFDLYSTFQSTQRHFIIKGVYTTNPENSVPGRAMQASRETISAQLDKISQLDAAAQPEALVITNL